MELAHICGRMLPESQLTGVRTLLTLGGDVPKEQVKTISRPLIPGTTNGQVSMRSVYQLARTSLAPQLEALIQESLWMMATAPWTDVITRNTFQELSL
eukprot:334876-Amphidinium_carterae.1